MICLSEEALQNRCELPMFFLLDVPEGCQNLSDKDPRYTDVRSAYVRRLRSSFLYAIVAERLQVNTFCSHNRSRSSYVRF